MSIYTDAEHTFAKEATRRWSGKTPKTAEEAYEYGNYFYRLKDDSLAWEWYEKASESGYGPAQYALAMCMLEEREGHTEAEELFKKAAAYYLSHPEEEEGYYRLGMLYLNGYGVKKDEALALKYFQKGAEKKQGGALYEMGLFYRDGKGRLAADTNKAREYFRKAYDAHWEEAIFADFALFKGPFAAYEYPREIKDAYSFLLGQWMRVAENRPSRKALVAIVDLYRQGYPEDTGEKRQAFLRKGRKFQKRLEQMP